MVLDRFWGGTICHLRTVRKRVLLPGEDDIKHQIGRILPGEDDIGHAGRPYFLGRTILVSGGRSVYRSTTGEDQRITFPGIKGKTLERKYLTFFHLARQKSA
jgi:hypothetical protein